MTPSSGLFCAKAETHSYPAKMILLPSESFLRVFFVCLHTVDSSWLNFWLEQETWKIYFRCGVVECPCMKKLIHASRFPKSRKDIQGKRGTKQTIIYFCSPICGAYSWSSWFSGDGEWQILKGIISQTSLEVSNNFTQFSRGFNNCMDLPWSDQMIKIFST